MKKVFFILALIALAATSACTLDFDNRNIGESALYLVDTFKLKDLKVEASGIWAASIAETDPVKSYKGFMANYENQVKMTDSVSKQLPSDQRKKMTECFDQLRKVTQWTIISQIFETSSNSSKLKSIAADVLPKDPSQVSQAVEQVMSFTKELASEFGSERDIESADDQENSMSVMKFYVLRSVALGWVAVDPKKANPFIEKAYEVAMGMKADMRVQLLGRLLVSSIFDKEIYDKCFKELTEMPHLSDNVSEEGRKYIRKMADVSLLISKMAANANLDQLDPDVKMSLTVKNATLDKISKTDRDKIAIGYKKYVPEISQLALSEDEFLKKSSLVFILILSKFGLKEEAKQCFDNYSVSPKKISESGSAAYETMKGLCPVLMSLEGSDLAFRGAIDSASSSANGLYEFLTIAATQLNSPLDSSLIDYARGVILKTENARAGDRAFMLNLLAYCTNGSSRELLLKEADEQVSKHIEENGKSSLLCIYMIDVNCRFDLKRTKEYVKQAELLIGDDVEARQNFCTTALGLFKSALVQAPNTDFSIESIEENYNKN